MKILIINNNVFMEQNHGLYVFKTTGEFATELKELGNEVEMFQTRVNSISKIHNFNVLDKGLKITTTKKYNIKIISIAIAFLTCGYRIFKNDFVYIFCPSYYKYLAIFAILTRKKFGLNIRGQKGVDSLYSKFLYKHAKVVFTVSPNFTKIVNSVGGNGINKKPTITFTYKDIVKDRKYTNHDLFTILFLGRIDKEKGLNELLDAIYTLKGNTSKRLHLRIVGDGPDRLLFEKKSHALNIEDCVEFCGAINNANEIKEIYLSSDIYILPTYHEGFPRTIYEAMIFGTPIITTFVGGISGIMIENHNCYRIFEKSSKSICDKIEYVLNNYSEAILIASNASKMIGDIIGPDKLSHSQKLNEFLLKLKK